MIGVVVATTDRPTLRDTVASINAQTLEPDQVVVVHDDERKGAPWARNTGVGWLHPDIEWIVFSDDDIYWEPNAFRDLSHALLQGGYDFAYGAYGKGERLHCIRQFDPEYLRKQNYISTMSMVRASAFPGFDEKLHRLQDWDLWLTMVERGSVGVQCGSIIFRTPENGGISSNGKLDWRRAERRVKKKHGLT